MVTRAWKVYGADGHRQKAAFGKSIKWDFSENGKTRKVEIIAQDRSETTKFAIMVVTCDTYGECVAECQGQLKDGAFENCKVGRVVATHWYAVVDGIDNTKEPDFKTGSYALAEALKMAREKGCRFIAEVDEGCILNGWVLKEVESCE